MVGLPDPAMTVWLSPLFTGKILRPGCIFQAGMVGYVGVKNFDIRHAA
jgi:hypothetical protein